YIYHFCIYHILNVFIFCFFFFSSRRRHTRWPRDWSSDVCSSDLVDRQARTDARGPRRLSRRGRRGARGGGRRRGVPRARRHVDLGLRARGLGYLGRALDALIGLEELPSADPTGHVLRFLSVDESVLELDHRILTLATEP